MNKDFDNEILSISEKIRGGYAYLIANLSKIIAVVTAIVTAMLVFTDIAFLGFSSKEFTTTLALVLISSFIMYFSLEEAGERLWEESEEYKKLTEEYGEAVKKISLERLGALREYCRAYADDELLFRRKGALLSAGYTEEDYRSYLRGDVKEIKKKIALGRISRMRRVKLTPEMLLSSSAGGRERIRDPKRGKLIMLALKILPSIVCMLFTASVVLSTKELSLVTIIEGVMKLSTLPIVGFRGYVNGYNYKKDEESEWIKTKIRLLEGFLRSDANNTLHLS